MLPWACLKTLQTSNTNGHFSDNAAAILTFSVSTESLLILLEAEGTAGQAHKGLKEFCLSPYACAPKWSTEASDRIKQSRNHSGERVSEAREVLSCYHLLTKVLLEEMSGP